MKLIFNILAISGSAMFAGVLLAIGVILGGSWKSLPAPDFLNVFNDNSQLISQIIAPVTITVLVGLAGSIWLSWGDKDARTLWLGAATCIMVLLVFTLLWFAPTNAQFSARSLPIDQVQAKRDMWLMLHNFRIVLAALASILGMIAISR
jgi:hypothetical protein